jgi:hypothetical protein
MVHHQKKVVNIASVRENRRELRDCIPFFQIVIVCANGKEFENYDFFDKNDQMRIQHLAETQNPSIGGDKAHASMPWNSSKAGT